MSGSVEVNVQVKDKKSLSRLVELRINGNKIPAPMRAISIGRSSQEQLSLFQKAQINKEPVIAEAYAQLNISQLEDCLDEEEGDENLRELSTSLNGVLSKAQESGNATMLVLSIMNNQNQPLNGLPDDRTLKLILDILWSPKNSIVVAPMFGLIRDGSDIDNLIDLMAKQQDNIVEKPIMAMLSSTYRPIAAYSIAKYWEQGVRLFGIDMEGRSLLSQTAILNMTLRELNELRQKSKEDFYYHGFNVKNRVGAGEKARVNDLLAHGIGLDSTTKSHIVPRRAFPKVIDRQEQLRYIYFLQNLDYGYYNFSSISGPQSETTLDIDKIALDGKTSRSIQSDTISNIRNISNEHNLIRGWQEESRLREELSSSGTITDYLEKKKKVEDDVHTIESFASKIRKGRGI